MRFFDLNASQKELFNDRWKRFSKRIAESKVENIVKQLKSLGQSGDPLIVITPLQAISSELMVDACSEFAPVIASLSLEQVEHFNKKLEERNSKFDPEKHGGLSNLRKSNHDEILASAKTWIGRISQNQKDLIRSFDKKKDELSQASWETQYLAYSREAQQVFSSIILNRRGDVSQVERECVEFVRTPEKFLSNSANTFKRRLSEFRQYTAQSWSQSLELDQREHLIRETSKLADELASWAKNVKN